MPSDEAAAISAAISNASDALALPPAPHLWPDTARVEVTDALGRLMLGGVRVDDLARRYGTPLYIYDEETIRAHCRAYRAAFARWPRSGISYAGKAYLSLAMCAVLREEEIGLDAGSEGEWRLALAGGFPSDHIHLHGNLKPERELAAAITAGIGRIVVDSLEEVDALARRAPLALAAGRIVRLWLRVRPEIEAATHAAIATGHARSKFGLDARQGEVLAAARVIAATPGLELVGLHAHIGSQVRDLAPLGHVVTVLGELAATLHAEVGIAVTELSPGGGLAVAYLPDEMAPSVDAYAETLLTALARVVERCRLAPPRLVVEPGRSLVARAGVALYTTGPRKATVEGETLLAVDGGMGDNPRPALYQAEYHAALAGRMLAPAEERVRIVGRYCESGDVLVRSVPLPVAHPGEVLAVPVSGAYHLAMASAYNLVPRPATVFVANGNARLVRRRETLDDMLRLEWPGE